MNHGRAFAALVLAFSFGVTACGNQGTAESAAPSEQATVATPSPSVETSTSQQLASVVAEHNAHVAQIKLNPECDMYEYVADGDPKAFMENVGALTCSMGKQTHSIRAQILATELGKLSPYPADMESLVADTIAKAESLAAIQVNDSCQSMSSVTEECRTARLSYKMAAPRLEATLAKWNPYGA
jgi:hypothetical protein